MAHRFAMVGGRKFALAVGTLVSATVLVWVKAIDDGVYSAVVIAVVGAYMAADVTEKATTKGEPE